MEIPKGYKMSEFGIIPEDWIETKWGDCLATFSSGATPYRGVPAYYKGNVKWISSGELNYNVISDTIEHISEQAVRDTNLKVHQPGTMLIAITGLEAEGTRGRCALVGTPATTNQSCLAINGTNKVCIEYLFEFYKMFGCALAFKYCQGTKQQSYTADIVKKLPIIYPRNIDEQKAIAKKLSEIDELIAGLGNQIEKKRQIKEGAMQQLLTGKTRLPGFRQPWVDIIIEDVANRFDNLRIPIAENLRIKGDIPYYGANGIVDYVKGFTHEGEFVLLAEDGANSLTDYPIRFVSGKIWVNNHAHVLQAIKGIADNLFLSYAFKLIDFESSIVGSGRAKLNAETMMKLCLSIPSSITEQTAIAQILSDMDTEIHQLEAERDKYTLIKQGMMQELLTGKTRLV